MRIFYFSLDRKIPGIGIEKISKIMGIGIGIWKSKEKSQKTPRAKSRKSQNPGDRDLDLKTPKNPKKIPKNLEQKIPKFPKSSGSGFFIPGIEICFTWDAISREKPTFGLQYKDALEKKLKFPYALNRKNSVSSFSYRNFQN